MKPVKAFSRRTLFVVLMFMLLLFGIINGLLSVGYQAISEMILALERIPDPPSQLVEFVNEIVVYKQLAETYFLPISGAFFFVFAIVLWFFLRIINGGLFKKEQKTVSPKTKKGPAEESRKIKEEKREQDRRIYLYLISLLQREGRLLDFFSENLDLYEDSQIGAAVRNIHQNCKKVVDKNLSLRPVVDKNEGEEIVVEPDFDPNAIKLTGNVTGDPPFKGILRHKGWQTEKPELPTLSSGQDSRIIAPAEVEVV